MAGLVKPAPTGGSNTAAALLQTANAANQAGKRANATLPKDGSEAMTGTLTAPAATFSGAVSAGSASISGTLSAPVSGDLSGTLPSPTVAKIQGKAFSATAPTTGQVPRFNGTQWAPSGGSNSLGSSGFTTLPDGVILQWGKITGLAVGSASTITLPTTFPNNFFGAQVMLDKAVTVTQALNIQSNSLSQFVVGNPSGNASSVDFFWLAYGN